MDVEEQAEMDATEAALRAVADAPAGAGDLAQSLLAAPLATVGALTKRRLPTDVVPIDGMGKVEVRGLSRYEVLVSKDKEERLGVVAMERMMLAAGVVNPSMTEADVTAWQKAAPAGEIEPVINKIAELSGMLDDAAKAAYKSNGGGPVA